MYNNIRLYIVTPYEEQPVGWHEEHRERYFNVHYLSDDVYMMNTRFYEGCYDAADEYIIDRSDLLLICGKADESLHSVQNAKENGVEYVHTEII